MAESPIWNWSNVGLAVAGLVVGAIPFRRQMTPTVNFLEPIPRPTANYVWWHIPVRINESESWWRSQLTMREIAECEADIFISEFDSPKLELHWESDNPNGSRQAKLDHKHEFILPIAIRATEARPIYVNAMNQPVLSLIASESFITEKNFVHHHVKHEPARLIAGKKYSVTVELKTHSLRLMNWNPSAKYDLYIPAEGESNERFKLERRS